MTKKQPALTVQPRFHTPDLRSTGVDVQTLHLSSGAHHHRGGGPGRIHPKQLGVTTGIGAGLGPAQRQGIRIQPLANQGQPQLLKERLHRLGGHAVVGARSRFGGIHTPLTMHPI